jgi:L-ascorbate metabolism protein UlaG (beta-lactamase superfamily)
VSRPPQKGEGARLTWLGHASWLVQLDGVSFVVDPVLVEAIGGFLQRNVPVGVPPDQLPPLSAALVTHAHYDHLDVPSLRKLGAPVIAGTGVGKVLEPRRLRCEELGWWERKGLGDGDITITFVPAQHWSRRGLFDTNATLWGGFVIEGSSARLYHTGDTAYFDGFAEIGRRFPDLDAALLPIGAYDPAWFMERQHMNPEQAVQAFRDLGARTFLAMHWGTFKLTDEPLDEPPRRLRAEWARLSLPEERLKVLAIGESIDVKSM